MEESVLLISLAEAARRLGVCKRTVSNLIAAKELRSLRVGRRRMVPVSSLRDFLRRDHLVIRKPETAEAP